MTRLQTGVKREKNRTDMRTVFRQPAQPHGRIRRRARRRRRRPSRACEQLTRAKDRLRLGAPSGPRWTPPCRSKLLDSHGSSCGVLTPGIKSSKAESVAAKKAAATDPPMVAVLAAFRTMLYCSELIIGGQ